MATMRKWVKEPKVEHHLRSLSIKFDTAIIELVSIDRSLSADHQTRLGKKIDEPLVLQYAAAMETGSAFPMPILNKLKKGYFIWSGNHRVGAADLLGDTHLEAYVVEVHDSRICDILPRIVNAWEGRAIEKEERLINAAYLVEHHSMDVQEAANLLNLKYEHLSSHMRTQNIAKVIRDEGINPNGFPKSLMLRMASVDNRNILRETCRLIHAHKVVGREAEDLLSDVKASTTELQAMSELGRWETMLKARTAPVGRKAPKLPHRQVVRDRLLRAMGMVAKLVDGPPKRDSRTKLQLVDDADWKQAQKLWRSIRNMLDAAMEDE